MYTLKEKVNEQKLEEIIMCSNILFKNLDDDERKKTIYKKGLVNYYKSKPDKNGYRKISYEKAKNSTADERLYAKPFGLQNMKKEMRVYVCDDYYYDLDIKSCHPNIVNYLLKKYNINVDHHLTDFLLDRKLFETKHNIKKLDFLKFINTSNNTIKKLSTLHSTIYDSLLNILKQKYKHIYKSINKNYNKDGSFLNHIFCSIERKILDCALSVCKDDYNIEPSVLCFDGFMLEKSIPLDIDFVLSKINNKLSTEFDYPFEFVNKEMEVSWVPEFDDCETNLKTEFHVAIKSEYDNDDENGFDERKIALAFIEKYNKPKPQFVYIRKSFWTWDGTIWIEDTNEYYLGNALINLSKQLSKMTKYKKVVEWLKRLLGNYELVFSPYKPVKPYQINTFKGFQAKYIDGVVENDIKEILAHIKQVNCNGHDDRYQYILSWFAYMLKVGKNETCPFFFGEIGAGKTTIPEYFIEYILGEYGIVESDIGKVFGKFNSTRETKVFILLDEATTGKSNYMLIFQQIKDAITGKRFTSETKGVSVEGQKANITSFMFSGNYLKGVLIEDNDRRFTVQNVSSKFVGDTDYFNKLHSVIDNQEYANKFYSYLIDRDLSSFNPRLNIFTEEARLAQLESTSVGLFIQDITDPDSMNYIFKEKNEIEIESIVLYDDYFRFYNDNHLKGNYKCYDSPNFSKLFFQVYGQDYVERTRKNSCRGFLIKKRADRK